MVPARASAVDRGPLSFTVVTGGTGARLFHEVLETAAQDGPGDLAIRWRRTSWSYERLATEAWGLAATLVELGVQPGDRVGILIPKRPESIAAVYAISRAGGAVVPMDPYAPPDWNRAIIRDCGITALITTPDRLADVAGSEDTATLRCAVVLADASAEGPLEESPAAAIAVRDYTSAAASPARSPAARRSEDLAFVYYTSGSTGRPKGVMHSHGTLLSAESSYRDRTGLTADDRVGFHPPLHFKMGLEGFFPGAMVRAPSVIVPMETAMRGEDLVRLIRDEAITVWKSVPAPVRALAEAASQGMLPTLRLVICGGGAWRPEDARAMKAIAPNAGLWQSFGSTEGSTLFMHEIADEVEDGRPVPLGEPLPDTRPIVVADDGSVPPDGEPGELYVSGPKVMLGYWETPRRRRRCSSLDPRGGGDDTVWYRTGDLVRRRPEDGMLEFVGRRDHSIKSRGYRIELGQVEVALRAHPAVLDAAVVAIPHDRWGQAMVGFVEVTDGAVSEGALRGHVASTLPGYMVPMRIVCLDRLPLTERGKVDRVRLGREARAGTPAVTVG